MALIDDFRALMLKYGINADTLTLAAPVPAPVKFAPANSGADCYQLALNGLHYRDASVAIDGDKVPAALAQAETDWNASDKSIQHDVFFVLRINGVVGWDQYEGLTLDECWDRFWSPAGGNPSGN